MHSGETTDGPREPLLTMTGLRIEGQADDEWHEIVHGVDVVLHRGEVLGLIGESGAGKSTIGLAAMGFARPGCRLTGGDIVFDGVELRGAPRDHTRALRGARIAYVAQSAAAAFNPAHRLIDQFSEAPVRHRVKSRAAAETDAKDLYKRLQLPEPEKIGYRYPHQVSGGQLQRAMVAMAMSCRPDLIVFDEPTTALDVTTQIEVLAAIKDVVRQFNTAAIYISHDLAVVAQMADRIMVLRHGNLVEEGTADRIVNHPTQDYTQKLLAVRSYRKPTAEPPAEEPLLRVDGVSARYRRSARVLESIDLAIGRQRTVAIVGESGSGKSTLARVVTGLLPPEEGKLVFDGKALAPALARRPREQLRRLQMIHQMPDTALNPRHRTRDVIGRPLTFYSGLRGRKREDRVRELLDMVELDPDEFIDRYPAELSGGQKQRVCIARALAAQPDLIICDEVTSALDQLVAERVLQLLQRLQDDLGVSYMFITHDFATVRAISDEIVVMFQGRIVEQGARNEVLSPPHHAYTDLLLSSVPEMKIGWLDQTLAGQGERQAGGDEVLKKGAPPAHG